MRRPIKNYQQKLNKKRFRKKLKRKKFKRRKTSLVLKIEKYNRNYDIQIFKHAYFDLHEFFIAKGFIGEKFKSNAIAIPKNFSLINNYEEVIFNIKRIIATIINNIGKQLIIDFSNCKQIDFPALFLLGVIKNNYESFYKKLNGKTKILKASIDFLVQPSNLEQINIFLLMAGFLNQAQGKDLELEPVLSTGYIKGQKNVNHYLKNQKGPTVTRIVSFVNECIGQHDYVLSYEGLNNLDGIVSEVLNNCEDHGVQGDWNVSAIFLKTPNHKDKLVGEINLAIMNFGDSFFEGFESTKIENAEMYDEMERVHDYITKIFPSAPFTKENLFTLYSLQEGCSRLKYQSESRGTGTIKFINSFLEIGDYEDIERGFSPLLSIISGNTFINCDTLSRPFLKDNVYYISLNMEQDLTKLPLDKYLKHVNMGFPGTLFCVKIYLNKEHLDSKYGK